jgi:hypothetical protein
MTIRGLFATATALALSISLAGCGGSSASVGGKVTLPGGAPAKGVFVVFEEQEENLGAIATTDEHGNYILGGSVPGASAPPGNYAVSVHQPGQADSSQAQPPPLFPRRYSRAATSGLTCELKAGENTFNIELKSE